VSRIVYLAFPTGAVSGGQKMIVRHVETLRDLGFEAVIWRNSANAAPAWIQQRAPTEVATPFRPDDVLVAPSDAPNAMAATAEMTQRVLVFCQNQFSFAALGFEALERFPAARFPTFLTPGACSAEAVRRIYPTAEVEIIRCFADERIFAPGAERRDAVALSPRKRPSEARAIRHLLHKLHPRHAALPWVELDNVSEQEVAQAFGRSSLFLSLSRFEAVGMTPLEAMASGCVCAGFLGIGGQDFGTPENGFWAPEDDVYAAAEALAAAADLVATGGPALARMREAARETARLWSYAAFRDELETVWMRLAPEARRRNGPLD
jgi:hypothetical protein